MTDENKSDFDISKDIFIRLNKKGLLIWTLFISSLIVLFIDYQFDLNIYVYLVCLLVTFFITQRIIRWRYVKRYKQKAIHLEPENLNFFYETLRVSDNDGIISFKIKDCSIILEDSFLFLRTPSIIINKQITSKLFVVKANSVELSQKYNSLIATYPQKNKVRVKTLSIVYIVLSILFFAWKIDLYVLNKYFYDQDVQWKVIRIEKDNETIFNVDSLQTGYLGLKNNFTKDTSDFWSDTYFLHYRHEPFLGIRLIFGSGRIADFTKNNPIRDRDFLGRYDAIYEPDTLKLINKEYIIICTRNE